VTQRQPIIACFALLAFAACNGAGESNDAEPLTRAELLDPESCGDCHPKHYREWSASMHAYAAKDPVFLAMNRRGQEETKGELGDFCVNCHAPMAVRENAFGNGDFGDLEQVPEHLQGVTCYFCHNVESVGKDHFNNGLILANDTVMRGGIRDPLQPGAHEAAYSQLFDRRSTKSSEMCGACHDIVTPKGVHLERTFAEYKGSIFANLPADGGRETCNGCHMTGTDGVAADFDGVGARRVHEHLFPGVDVPLDDFPHRAAMTAAVRDCALPSVSISFFDIQVMSPLPGEFSFKVFLETNAGHNQPSGASQDRRMWLEVTAFDAAGDVVFESGKIADDELEEKPPGDPDHDPHLWQFRERMLDAEGNEVHMFWEAESTSHEGTDPLPVGTSRVQGSHALDREYMIGSVPAKVELRLRIRPVGLDVLDNLIASKHLAAEVRDAMPTFTVFTAEGVFDSATMRFKNTDTTEFDCDTYLCMLDPEADACD
jgi:hypothetical protein